MKRKYLLFPILLLTLCIVLSPASFKAEAGQKDLETLLDERQIDCWVEGEVFDFFVIRKHREADLDDIAQVHLQRLNRPEAPQDREDDLPERFHG